MFLFPLFGGSGGGGGASSAGQNGGGGGGGGGAIAIASSSDIVVNGTIRSKGGLGRNLAGFGGKGTGGAILLIADRVLGGGTLDVTTQSSGPPGVIRIEGYERQLADRVPTAIVGVPVLDRGFTNLAVLTVSEVDGEPVPQPPFGLPATPDVFFYGGGVVDVKIATQNLPDGTPVRLIIASDGATLETGPEAVSGNEVVFSVDIPAGRGTIQAVVSLTP